MYKRPIAHTAVALLIAGMAVAPAAYSAPRDVSHSTPTEVRLDYLSRLLNSKSGQRLKELEPDTARRVQEMLNNARAAVASGNQDKADTLGKTGLSTIMQAIQKMPENPEETARHKARYENLRQGLTRFIWAQEENMERFNSDPAGLYNENEVTTLFDAAEKSAQNGKYQQAIAQLNEAQGILTASLHGLLNDKQLVIELDIGTPEKEYAYEVRRYMGYEELIPIALDVKKPSPPVAEKMVKLGEKAKWMSEQARNKAIEQDYPVAIRMMMDATDVVRQALRMAGVMM